MDDTLIKKYTRDRRGERVPDRLKLMEVQKVQNDQNWHEFVIKRQAMQVKFERLAAIGQAGQVNRDYLPLKTTASAKKMGKDWVLDEGLDENIGEFWFFHGTSQAGAEGITSGDFRVDLAGSNAGTLYGRGVYLAEACSKSDEYCHPTDDGTRILLLCRAMLGSAYYTDERNPDPELIVKRCMAGSFDSVLGDREKCSGTFREFIIYDDDQVYPQYICYYKREYGTSGN